MIDDDDLNQLLDDDEDDDEDEQEKTKNKNKNKKNYPSVHLNDELIQQIRRSVEENIEERLQLRVKKSLIFIRFALIVVFLVLAPAAWFSVRNLIDTSIDSVNQKIYATVEKLNQEVEQEVKNIKTRVDNELIYLKLSNESETLKQRVDLNSNELGEIMEDLRTVSNLPEIHKSKGFSILIEEIIDAFLKYGYEDYVQELQKLYPYIFRDSIVINEKIFVYYARKLLGSSDISGLTKSKDFKRFNEFADSPVLANAETHVLAMQMLVQFHIANGERNPATSNLLASVNSLRFNDRSIVLWNIFRNVNPLFWQRNPLSTDFRIAKVANKFVDAYRSDLMELANGNGVKETLLNMYEYANTAEDIRLGRYLMYYLYKIPVD